LRKILLLAAIVASGAGLYLYSWHKPSRPGKDAGHNRAKNRPVAVMTARASRKDVPIYLDGLGTVQAYNTVTIRSRVDGELIEVAYKEGQDVKAGDVLARIDSRIYQAQFDQAAATRDKDAAQLENARKDLQRYLSLGNRVTGQSVDSQRALVRQFEAAVRADQAQVDNAAAMLSYTTIKAPIDGRTGIRQVDAGNIVHANDAGGLVVLTQIQPISVVFTLPQQALQSVLSAEKDEKGRTTVIAVQADDKTEIDRGSLALVDNQIDTATGTFKLKAVMPNARRTLWPGGFVNVRLLVALRRNGLVIPATAVQRGPKGVYVFVVNEEKGKGDKLKRTVEVRPVKVAATEGELALIDGGLKDGEIIVVEGALKLKAGTPVMDASQVGGRGGKEQKKDKNEEKGRENAAGKHSNQGSAAIDGGEGRRHRQKETQ
jgi:multidrug efflux system membrane fusion protein